MCAIELLIMYVFTTENKLVTYLVSLVTKVVSSMNHKLSVKMQMDLCMFAIFISTPISICYLQFLCMFSIDIVTNIFITFGLSGKL